jgi:hypothetical protein
MGLFTPEAHLNYTFIAGAYTILTLISVVLYILQQEKMLQGVEGLFLIPAPASIGIVWALALRHCQRRVAVGDAAGSATTTATKKAQ